jgi:hypothetical protein
VSGTVPRVYVETDKHLTSAGGQGAGLFVEYTSGGHWYLWTTCDTAITGSGCAWEVDAQALSGTPTNVASASSSADGVGVLCPDTVSMSLVTRGEVDGVTFDLPAGVGIRLGSTIGGAADPRFVFVFGHYGDASTAGVRSGLVSDPIDVVPTSP